MADLFDNPMGTDGFEFVEYTAPDPEQLRTLFDRMGFPAVARHRRKNVTLHRQGDVNFIINAEPDGFGERFAQQHGPSAVRWPSASGMPRSPGPRGRARRDPVGNPGGRWSSISRRSRVRGQPDYLVDRYGWPTIYDVDFVPIAEGARRPPGGLSSSTI